MCAEPQPRTPVGGQHEEGVHERRRSESEGCAQLSHFAEKCKDMKA